MMETKGANIRTRMLRGNWTEESAQKAVSAWLKLSTSTNETIEIVGAQDDGMALGARKAFQEQMATLMPAERDRWKNLMFTGCDGLPKTGQVWVRNKTLKATVVVPANVGQALEMLVGAIRGGKPPLQTVLTEVSSYPTIDALQAGAIK